MTVAVCLQTILQGEDLVWIYDSLKMVDLYVLTTQGIPVALILFVLYYNMHTIQTKVISVLYRSKIVKKKGKANIIDDAIMSVVMTYFFQYNKGYVDKSYGFDFGVMSSGSLNPYMTAPEDGKIIIFHDTKFDIKGTITSYEKTLVRQTTTQNNGDKLKIETAIRALSLEIEVDKYSADEYVKMIQEECKAIQKKETTRVLYYKKLYSTDKASMHTMGTILINDIETREKEYIDTYFSPVKSELYNIAKMITLTPEKIIATGQSPSVNWLLHGPPGSGKSTWPYRLAMTLGRHVYCLDISTLVTNKQFVFETFRDPYIGNNRVSPSNVIFVLEEFDIVVSYLKRKLEEERTKPVWTLKSYAKYYDSDSDSDFPKRWKKKETEKESEDEDETVDPDQSGTENRNNLTLEDLLEVFQGPVPTPGSIIIATTNHLEKMKEHLPALFRPGRLTPVCFDNMDYATLQELSRYFWNQEIPIERFDRLKCATSEITEIVKTLHQSKTVPDDQKFRIFCERVYACTGLKPNTS